jgi:hypothetical protein
MGNSSHGITWVTILKMLASSSNFSNRKAACRTGGNACDSFRTGMLIARSAACLSAQLLPGPRSDRRAQRPVGRVFDLSGHRFRHRRANGRGGLRQQGRRQTVDVTADHQNKTDVGVGIAQRWYDAENIDAIFLPGSAIALAVAGMSEQKNRCSSAPAPAPRCSPAKGAPNAMHWTYDAMPMAAASASGGRQGGKKWFFTTDYAGHDLGRP